MQFPRSPQERRGWIRRLTGACLRHPGVTAAAQLIQLDSAGVAVSAGSACSSGTLKPSPTLTAMGWGEREAREVIRVSFAPATTQAEVDRFVALWSALAGRARAT